MSALPSLSLPLPLPEECEESARDTARQYSPTSLSQICGRFAHLLFRYRYYLIETLFRLQLKHGRPVVETRALVSLSQKTNEAFRFFHHLLRIEISSEAVLESLFRDFSPALQFVKFFFQANGDIFLSAVLSERLARDQLLYRKLCHKQKRGISPAHAAMIYDFIRHILQSFDSLPPLLAQLCAVVYRRICEVAPSLGSDMATRRVISSCLLLHFFCPSLVDPKGLIASERPRPKRGSSIAHKQEGIAPVNIFGTTVAKFFLQLANDTLDTSQEPGASLNDLGPAFMRASATLIERGEGLLALGKSQAPDFECKETILLLYSTSQLLPQIRQDLLTLQDKDTLPTTVFSELIELLAQIEHFDCEKLATVTAASFRESTLPRARTSPTASDYIRVAHHSSGSCVARRALTPDPLSDPGACRSDTAESFSELFTDSASSEELEASPRLIKVSEEAPIEEIR